MGENKIDKILNGPGGPGSDPTGSPSSPAPPGSPGPSGSPGTPGSSSSPGRPNSTAAPALTPPGGGGAGEVRFTPGDIRLLGRNLEQTLAAIFRQARYKLNAKPRDLEPAAFTTFGIECAIAHTEVVEYADEDLKSKAELAMDFNDRLQHTANIQDEAERKSTVQGGR